MLLTVGTSQDQLHAFVVIVDASTSFYHTGWLGKSTGVSIYVLGFSLWVLGSFKQWRHTGMFLECKRDKKLFFCVV